MHLDPLGFLFTKPFLFVPLLLKPEDFELISDFVQFLGRQTLIQVEYQLLRELLDILLVGRFLRQSFMDGFGVSHEVLSLEQGEVDRAGVHVLDREAWVSEDVPENSYSTICSSLSRDGSVYGSQELGGFGLGNDRFPSSNGVSLVGCVCAGDGG